MTALARVSAVAMAALLLREPVSSAQLAGVACVLGAVLLVTVGHMRRMPRHPA
jgi:drug/metabolite transporter (DMT)-like permease